MSHTFEDFGSNGVAWANDPLQVARAQAAVALGWEDYFRVVAAFWTQIERFRHEKERGS